MSDGGKLILGPGPDAFSELFFGITAGDTGTLALDHPGSLVATDIANLGAGDVLEPPGGADPSVAFGATSLTIASTTFSSVAFETGRLAPTGASAIWCARSLVRTRRSGHAISVAGALVPAWRLLNGVSIVQPAAAGQVRYFHIELATHELVLAEGCPAETYLEDSQHGRCSRRPEPSMPARGKPTHRVVQESGRFFEKKLRKKLLQPLHGMLKRPPAKNEQKSFAELFFRKATTFLSPGFRLRRRPPFRSHWIERQAAPSRFAAAVGAGRRLAPG